MKINCYIDKFDKIIKSEKEWEFANQILYDVCDKYREHTKKEQIMAKLWLIGRSYAVALERRKKGYLVDKFGNKMNVTAVYRKVAEAMINFQQEINLDERLLKLKDKSFDDSTVDEILEVHYELTKLFKKLTGQSKKSLASKYLHFHCPIFPIYDFIASNNLKKIKKNKIKKISNVNPHYHEFCKRLIYLSKEINEKNHKIPETRELDTFLYNYHRYE